MGDWTKEPWMVRVGLFAPHIEGYHDCDIQICRDRTLEHVALLHNEFETGIPDANRIVACVNAMQGIPDPAKFVEAFHAMVRELRTISKGIHCHGPGCPYCDSDCDHPRTVHAIDAEKLVAQALAAKPEEAK